MSITPKTDKPFGPLNWRERSGKSLEQLLRFQQVRRVQAFREPAAERSEQVATLPPLALLRPCARERRYRPQLPGPSLLDVRDLHGLDQVNLGLGSSAPRGRKE